MSQHRSPVDASVSAPGPAGASPFQSRGALAALFVTAAVGLAVDLATKVWAFKTLMFNRIPEPDGTVRFQSHTYEFIPGWLHFHVTGNHGAVFGTGQGYRWYFVAVSVLAIGFLLYLFATSTPRQRFYHVIVGMLLAGVLGNLYDRVVFGYVRDMIYMLPGRTWPTWMAEMLPAHWEWTRGPVFPWIFNVADALLCTGVPLMLAYNLMLARRAKQDERLAALKPAES